MHLAFCRQIFVQEIAAGIQILLQVSRRTVSWFRFIKSQDTQDDMIEKTNPVAKKIDNPVVTTYPVDNPVVATYPVDNPVVTTYPVDNPVVKKY